jgi:hypothetical protein
VYPRKEGRLWGCRSRPDPIGRPQRRQVEQQGAGTTAAVAGTVAVAGATAVVGRRTLVAAATIEVWVPEEDGGHQTTVGWCPSKGCRRWASPLKGG